MKEFDSSLSHAHSWLKLTQIKENVDMRYYRQRNLVSSVYSYSNLLGKCLTVIMLFEPILFYVNGCILFIPTLLRHITAIVSDSGLLLHTV